MKAHVTKLENNYIIVDKEYFNEIKNKAEFNQERIDEIVEERFLKYVKENRKIWKHFALIFIITTIVLTIRLFIQL